MTKVIIEVINGIALVLGGFMLALVMILIASNMEVIWVTDEGMFVEYDKHVYRLELVE